MVEHSARPDVYILGQRVGLARVSGPGSNGIAWVPLDGTLRILCLSKDLTPDMSAVAPIADFSHPYWTYFKKCGYLPHKPATTGEPR